MRQNLHYLIDIQATFSGQEGAGNEKRGDFRMLFHNLARQILRWQHAPVSRR